VLEAHHLPPIARYGDNGITFALFNIKNKMARKGPTVVASAFIDPDNPGLTTYSIRNGTLLVLNTNTNEFELPYVHEIEQMVGLPIGATAAPGITENQRRHACGDVIDGNLLTYLLGNLASVVPHEPTPSPPLKRQAPRTTRARTRRGRLYDSHKETA